MGKVNEIAVVFDIGIADLCLTPALGVGGCVDLYIAVPVTIERWFGMLIFKPMRCLSTTFHEQCPA